MPKSYRIGMLITCLFSLTIILFLLPSFFAAPENLEEQEDNSGSFARLIVSNVSQSTASPPLHRSRSRSRLRVAVVTVIDCPSPTSSSRFARFFNATYESVVFNRFEYCRAHDCEPRNARSYLPLHLVGSHAATGRTLPTVRSPLHSTW